MLLTQRLTGVVATILFFFLAQEQFQQSGKNVFAAAEEICNLGDLIGDDPAYTCVDGTFNCPAVVVCPVVCMAKGEACPDGLECPVFTNLCLDGSCAEDCSIANALYNTKDFESPCPDCRPVICPRVVLGYDTCKSAFGAYYENTTRCAELEEEESVDLFTLREGGFIAIYVWACFVPFTMIVWCYFNQRIAPVSGSTKPLMMQIDSSQTSWTQTGYQGLGSVTSNIGLFLYLLTMITLFGYQILLGILTIFYYIQQEAIAWFSPVFEDEVQVLKVHEITWGVAFFYTILLKWPTSIRSVFYRRCTLGDATHVAVMTPKAKERMGEETNSKLLSIKSAIKAVKLAVTRVMSFIYCDTRAADEEFDVTYCPVQIDESGTRHFFFRLRRYNFDEKSQLYIPGSIVVGETLDEFLRLRSGMESAEVTKRRSVVGANTIQMTRPIFIVTMISEFTKFFYTYQVFMIWTWFPLWYYYMACVQSIIVFTGGFVVSIFRYRNERNLYRITRVTGNVSVLRDGVVNTLSHTELVPGDIVVVEPGMAYADMVIISGNDIIVDEAALTGESTPIAKVAIDSVEGNAVYSYMSHKRHTISAGTRIVEAQGIMAVVLSTGSHTSKGEMLRDILTYQRHQFKFDTEVKVVVGILVLYAIFGFTLTVSLYKDDFVFEWFYGMFVVGTSLPPLLPTVFTVSVGVSDDRLARKRIACVNNEDILVAGKVRRVFFDKTGTLTKQGLDFIGASSDGKTDSTTKLSGNLLLGMATCHNLKLSSKGLLIGNHVDHNMFVATGTDLSQSADGTVNVTLNDGTGVKVLKRFEFDHHSMTQSVIVQRSNGTLCVFVKGSGESIERLCLGKTIPEKFHSSLENAAKQGIYQISLAMKELNYDAKSVVTLSRDNVESGLTFVGFINFKNQLREETPDVLAQLEAGDVISTMVTGDNTLTGINIAKEARLIKEDQEIIFGKSVDNAGIISWVNEDGEITPVPSVGKIKNRNIALAVTGKVWAALNAQSEDKALSLAPYIRVFGRCTPMDKVSVIETFVRNGTTCCMVGDGGNDCGALKTAHIGIALSDAEASVVAPFTSLDKSITSVVEVLKEGRCALASALASYKYMIIYGQVESINQIANAYFSVTFHEWCWVFMDGIWMMSMAFALSLAHAEKRLSPKRPTSSLLGAHTMFSALGVLAINFIFTCIALGLLTSQDWYHCRKWDSTDISNITLIGDNYEASVLFIVTGYQYISSAMAFNFGYTHRASWWKNYVFVSLASIYTVVHFLATLWPSKLSCLWRLNCTNENIVPAVTDTRIPINNVFNTTVMPMGFRIDLILLMVFNTVAIMSWEYFFVNGVGKKLAARFNRKSDFSNQPAYLLDHQEDVV